MVMVSKIAKQKTPNAKHQTHQLTNYHPSYPFSNYSYA